MSKHLFILLLTTASCISLNAAKASSLQEKVVDSGAATVQEIRYDQGSVEGASLDQELVESYKTDPDFDYREIVEEETWLSRLWIKLNEIWASFIRWLSGGGEATGIWAFLLELLPYLLIIGLIALLVWVFLKIDGPHAILAPTRKHTALLTDDADIIKNQDIQSLIDTALAEKKYRLAIRYYYLLTLQRLSSKELIDWQVQKTNHDYIYEIKDNNLRRNFAQATDLYDYIWYGNFTVDEYAFAKAQITFNTLNQQL